MNKYILKVFLGLLIALVFVPNVASAALLYFESSKKEVSVGDTFIVSIIVDSEDAVVNSIEGDIVFGSKVNSVVNDFSLAKSVFTLWPRTPSLSQDGDMVSFVGGLPGGLDLNKAVLFNIVVEAQKEGEINLSARDLSMFASDGQGTVIPVKSNTSSIKVNPKRESGIPSNEWVNLVLGDKTSPKEFPITLGRETSLFEGKRFAFFTAIDEESGISYYEVSENGKLPVRSGSMYLLENQDENLDPDLVVTAYDKAGNKTISKYQPVVTSFFGFTLKTLVVTILGIVVVLFFLIRFVKNKKNAKRQSQIQS